MNTQYPEINADNPASRFQGIADYILRDALKPTIDWDEGSHIHNWRNWVGESTRAIWQSLTDEQKVAIAVDADHLSGKEEWE